MGNLLSKVINLGGLFDGSKTYLGLIALAYYLISTYKPEYKPLLDKILEILGLTLLPVGLLDKAQKRVKK